MKFEHPKLFESVTRGGDCALCGKEVARGDIAWVWNGDIYCGSHKRTDVEEAAKNHVDALRTEGVPPTRYDDLGLLIDAINHVGGQLSNIERTLTVLTESFYKYRCEDLPHLVNAIDDLKRQGAK